VNEERFALLPTTRWLAPLAIALGLIGAAVADSGRARVLFGGGTAIIATLWLIGVARRPYLSIDSDGYRVVEGTKERLRVRFDEVVRARAVAVEQAMYVDCGDPARNLLLPPRRGYGFRFARQGDLYVILAKALEAKLEMVDSLEPPDKKPDTKPDTKKDRT